MNFLILVYLWAVGLIANDWQAEKTPPDGEEQGLQSQMEVGALQYLIWHEMQLTWSAWDALQSVNMLIMY